MYVREPAAYPVGVGGYVAHEAVSVDVDKRVEYLCAYSYSMDVREKLKECLVTCGCQG